MTCNETSIYFVLATFCSGVKEQTRTLGTSSNVSGNQRRQVLLRTGDLMVRMAVKRTITSFLASSYVKRSSLGLIPYS